MRPSSTISPEAVPTENSQANGKQQPAPHTRSFETPQQSFIWGAGIECSFIPHLGVNQFEWTQHDRFWKDDFRRAREELGISALRYALPWHSIERNRGEFDWASADERVQTAADMKINLYMDGMHFGTPQWLTQAAGDPEFPDALQRFTEALVTRYRGAIKNWCPCNEPLILALFSGDFGFWPPHSRGWRGYMPVLSRVVQATNRAIRAIRNADPFSNVIFCDNVENYKSRVPELQSETHRRNQRRFLALDLLLGRVDRHHPLFKWVTDYGLSEVDLDWFAANPQRPDILGIDYYPNSEWQLDMAGGGIHQRRSESPAGLYGIAKTYYERYGLPMMLTETSADGHPINREIWLEQTVRDCRRLRQDGIPMHGFFWWPMIDQVDWDGALTHQVGKIHDVGIYNLKRLADGTLARHATPLIRQFADFVRAGDAPVGKLEFIAHPVGNEIHEPLSGNLAGGNASDQTVAVLDQPPANDGLGSHRQDHQPGAASAQPAKPAPLQGTSTTYGIVVFSHLRWGFVWQRPQQFLSRFAKNNRVLFVEEPVFDLPPGADPRLDYHKVMPNVTVICPHLSPSWMHDPQLYSLLRKYTAEGIQAVNDNGDFDKPLLWYYSPMDSAWSLGHFPNCGVVYDCMDELSQFIGAPKSLIDNEARLMSYADVVFTGGYQLGEKKARQHSNVHCFGCGVDFPHFSKASDPDTRIPPDIDFMKRPILGWFGVVDERVDYAMVGEMAKLRPAWSFAMVGPVVKVDPNLLPHAPNLFWLGGREYQQLPNYARAFDVNMMCFAMNAATEFINPTKGLEYMATGKPIVSTPVRDVVRQWSDVVWLASTAQEFIAAAEEALRAGPTHQRVARGIELARKSSWESTVESMRGLIGEALQKPSRPSAKKIVPLRDEELREIYASTQGS